MVQLQLYQSCWNINKLVNFTTLRQMFTPTSNAKKHPMTMLHTKDHVDLHAKINPHKILRTVIQCRRRFFHRFFSVPIENMHHLPNASPKSVQLSVTPEDSPAQVSLHLSWVWRQLPLCPLPGTYHQELPALHPESRLPVS